MAPAPEDLLGGGGGVLHGGADRHLHVPVQKCLRTVQTDHGHVRGGVSRFNFINPVVSALAACSPPFVYGNVFVFLCAHLNDQSPRPGFGAVRHGGAVCTHPTSCHLSVGLHSPAALL